MTRFPLAAVILPCLAALAAAQAFAPTVHADSEGSLPEYQVRVLKQTVTRGAGGLIVQGRLRNTGHKVLTYTQVTSLLTDNSGREIFRGQGYLTVSPLAPGQSAEFRVCEPDAPTLGTVKIVFREAGHPVVAELPHSTQTAQGASASTTVR